MDTLTTTNIIVWGFSLWFHFSKKVKFDKRERYFRNIICELESERPDLNKVEELRDEDEQILYGAHLDKVRAQSGTCINDATGGQPQESSSVSKCSYCGNYNTKLNSKCLKCGNAVGRGVS